MRKQGYGRIIQCSSILGFITLSYRGPYNATKWALEGYTDTLRLELQGTGINVISVRPGPIKTLIRENSLLHFKKWVDWETRLCDWETQKQVCLYAERLPSFLLLR